MAKKSMAHSIAGVFCMAPDIKGLTQDQMNALHVFKHEVLAGCFRLYAVVPPDRADKILAKYFQDAFMMGLEAEAGEGRPPAPPRPKRRT
jgi:hypothetical protein